MILKLKLKKCQFAQSSTTYSGHIISDKGVTPDPDKVNAMKNLKSPKTVRQVRSFLGMSGFYRKFIKNYADMAMPLTQLTQKNVKFVWTEQCENSLREIIRQLALTPLLSHPDINLPYILYTDASDLAIGAVLTQSVTGNDEELRPI